MSTCFKFPDEFNNQVRQRSNRSSTPSSCSTLTGGTSCAMPAPASMPVNTTNPPNSAPVLSSLATAGAISKRTTLSSPDIIKSVSRNLTPPMPPQSQTAMTPVASALSNPSTPTAVPISDPLIDTNWPGNSNSRCWPQFFTSNAQNMSIGITLFRAGRPKRRGDGQTPSLAMPLRQPRSFSPRRPPPAQQAASISSAEPQQPTTPSGSMGKPPIFPSSPPPPSQPNESSSNQMPPFMREFVARRSNRNLASSTSGPTQDSMQFNPNEPAPFKRQQSSPTVLTRSVLFRSS